MPNIDNELEELRGSRFEIADDEPEILGWDVKDRQGMKVGKVNDLLFDPKSLKVRYIIIDLNADSAKNGTAKVLIPIGVAELHPKDNDVILSTITGEQLLSLPEYERGSLNMGMETSIRNILAAGGAAVTSQDSTLDDFYDHDHFNEDNFYRPRRDPDITTTIPIIEERIKVGKRVIEKGRVIVKTSIAEVPIEETIVLKEEHVTIERNVVDKPLSGSNNNAFEETTIQLKQHAEVPVVTREARVIEEISVGKEVEERDETIIDSVRKTEIEDLDSDGRTTDTRQTK